MTDAVALVATPDAPAPQAGGLRVLHAVRRYGEASQTFVVDALLETARLGYEPSVLSTQAPENLTAFPDPPLERRHRPCRPARARQLGNRLFRRSPRERSADWWREPVRASRADVLHVHFGWTAAHVSLPRLQIPVLVSFHGSDVNAWPGKHPGNRAAYDAFLPEIRRATVVSRFIEGNLRALGYQGDVAIVPAGVRLEAFPYSEPDGRGTGDELRLLFVGRQVACKGLDVLIRALPATVAALPDRPVTLEVVGDGDDRASNEALARELGVERRVRFLGPLPRAGVVAAIGRADALVVPSRVTPAGEAEGSPVVPKEAMAMGVPVVATDVGGMAETVPPAYVHELVAPDAPLALAAQIAALAASPEDAIARARTGRQWVEEAFDWSMLAGRIGRIYDDLAASSRG